MNSVSQTKIFNRMNTIYGDIPKEIGKIDLIEYAIPTEFYMDIVNNFKDYKHPLARKTFEMAKKGDIIPIILCDPVDSNKPLLSDKIPQVLLTFGILDKYNKKIKFCVDVSMKGSYVRNKLDKTVLSCKIDPVYLYAFMQILLVYRDIKLNDKKYTNARMLQKVLAECYGIILSKIIDQKLSISANRDDYNILLFLCICFYFENMVGLSKDQAIERAKQYKFLFKDIIDIKCEYIRNDLDMQYDENEAKKNDIYPIDKFIIVVRDQFSTLGDKLNYRELLSWYTNMYGQNSIVALEDSTSFIQMMQLVNLRLNLYKDLLIEQSIKKTLPEIPKLLAQMID